MVLLRNMLALLSKRDRTAQRIYDQCVAAARAPEHFGDGRVADSVDGRFAMLALHLFIAARRLGQAGAEGRALVQALVDCFVRDMDRNLREMGAGDVGVAKNVKRMAHALNGQLHAYEAALTAGPEALRASLLRNVFGLSEDAAGALEWPVRRLAGYVQAQMLYLSSRPDADCLAGRCPLQPAAAAYNVAPGDEPGEVGR
jgi:cytochrome b pre-mRNA-processing protein 3